MDFRNHVFLARLFRYGPFGKQKIRRSLWNYQWFLQNIFESNYHSTWTGHSTPYLKPLNVKQGSCEHQYQKVWIYPTENWTRVSCLTNQLSYITLLWNTNRKSYLCHHWKKILVFFCYFVKELLGVKLHQTRAKAASILVLCAAKPPSISKQHLGERLTVILKVLQNV